MCVMLSVGTVNWEGEKERQSVFKPHSFYHPPPGLQAAGRHKRTNREKCAPIDTGAHQLTHGGDESAADRGSGQGPGVNRPPPRCPRTTPHHPRGSVSQHQPPGTNIRISADPSSARMPTSIDTNAEPVLSLLYLFILFSSLLSISGAPLPAPHSPIEDRRPVSRRPSGIFDL